MRWTRGQFELFKHKRAASRVPSVAAAPQGVKDSSAVMLLWQTLNYLGAGEWEREHVFHPGRRWRFDFANVRARIAVEVEGGIYQAGRHQRPGGYVKDMEKYNAAVLDGWMLLRFAPEQVLDGTAAEAIRQAIRTRKAKFEDNSIE